MKRTIYSPTDEVHGWVGRAYAGDEEARRRLEELEGPHALSPDGAALLHVQLKDAAFRPDGSIRILNKAPEPDGGEYPCADIYQCFPDGGSSRTHIPVPRSFYPAGVVFAAGGEGGNSMRFAFESADGRRLEASLIQMSLAFRPLDLIMQGATEAEIEEAFYGMEKLVAPPPPIKRTEADNPPIAAEGLGVLAFDESLQWFGGVVRAGEREIRAALDTAERDEALKLLPLLAELAGGLETEDAAARRYAAREMSELKNEVWLDEDEEEVTEEQFAERMTLESLTVDAGGGVTFWYADGELFAGHTICVERDENGEFAWAEMMG